MRTIHKLKRLARLSRICSINQLIKLSVHHALGTRLSSIRLSRLGHPLWWRGGNSDIRVLSQIFEHGECDIQLPKEPDLIIDGGANVGYSAVFFAHKYPGVPIIAIEPDRDNLIILKRNCDPYPQISSIQGAIWTRRANLQIVNPTAESWAFVVEEIPLSDVSGLSGFSVGDLVGEAKNVLLKLDIEGAETEIFSSETPWIDRLAALVIEVHGQEAESVVMKAMTASKYLFSRQGEKLMFIRRN